jgi:hypothetical protein
MLRLGIVTIALQWDKSFQRTLNSVSKMQKLRPIQQGELSIHHVCVINQEVVGLHLSKELAVNSNIQPSTFIQSMIIGKDRSLYHAMNLGAALIEQDADFLVFLNSGATISRLFDCDLFLMTASSNIHNILLLNAVEINPSSSGYRRRLWHSMKVKSWKHSKFQMPACHQSIFYPAKLFSEEKYLEWPSFIVSDYLHILAALKRGVEFSTVNNTFSVYPNNGLSRSRPFTSILQRGIAYYLVYDKIFVAIWLTSISIIRQTLKLIYDKLRKF